MGKVKGHQVKEVEDFVFHVSLSKDLKKPLLIFTYLFAKELGVMKLKECHVEKFDNN